MPQQCPTWGKKIEVVTTFHMAKRFVITQTKSLYNYYIWEKDQDGKTLLPLP